MKKNKKHRRSLYQGSLHQREKLKLVAMITGIAAVLVIIIGICMLIHTGRGTGHTEPSGIPETETAETTETETQDFTDEDETAAREVSDPNMQVHFIDVGQGDATLILCKDQAILIDTGSSEASIDILDYLDRKSVEKLDYLILSHGHEDHMGRGVDILEKIKVDHVICDFGNQEGYVQRLNNYIKDMEIDVILPKDGEVYQVGEFSFTILMGRNPQLFSENEPEVTNVNNQSLAVKVVHGNNSFLFYGDGELAYEQYLMEQKIDVSATVLKVPHHGAAASGSEAILDQIDPRYAVISSAPQEAFGYPSNEVLQRLALKQITAFYTNKQGTVTAISDGETLHWTAER